jgi:hypothetical protein
VKYFHDIVHIFWMIQLIALMHQSSAFWPVFHIVRLSVNRNDNDSHYHSCMGGGVGLFARARGCYPISSSSFS